MTASYTSRYRSWFGMFVLVSGIMLTGCRQEAEPVVEEPIYRPQPIAFSNNNDMVVNPFSNAGPDSRRVIADFNMDGRMDIALLNKREDGTTDVEIFIRKPAVTDNASSHDPAPSQSDIYYRAGIIQGTARGNIIGIASQTKGAYTDLRVIIETPGQDRNLHILYRNNGQGFFQVDEL